MTQTASARIHALVTPGALELPARGQAPITLVVTNRGRVVDQLQLQVAGLDPGWYTLVVPSINLLPETSGGLRLDVHVPPDAVAGDYVLHLSVASQEDPSESVQVDVPLQILAQGALGLELIPAMVTSRRLGHFRVHASNTSNELHAIDLVATDPDEALELALDRDHLVLDPGANDSVWLTARPRQRPLIARPRTLPFTVTAMSDTELAEPLAGAQGRLVYRAPLALLVVVPPRLRALALAALGLLVALGVLIWLLGQPGVHGPFAQPSPTVAPTTAPAAAAQPAQPTVAESAGAATSGPSLAAASMATHAAPPEITHFGLNLAASNPPAAVPLDWSVSGATSTRVDSATMPSADPDPQAVESADYTLRASNAAGTTSEVLTIYVLRPPVIDDFSASLSETDGALVVTWQTSRADRVYLNNQVLDGTSGSVELAADAASQPLVLRAENAVGQATRQLQPGPPGQPTPTATPTLLPQATLVITTPAPAGEPGASPSTTAPPPTPEVPAATVVRTDTATPAPVVAQTLPPTPTSTLPPAPAPSATLTPSPTPSPTEPTATATVTATATSTTTPGAAPTFTLTVAPTFTATETATATLTETPTPTPEPPSIAVALEPTPNAQGWTNAATTITWTVTDANSTIGSSSGCEPSTVSTDTAGTTFTCTATNAAGQTTSRSVTVQVDTTPPKVTFGTPSPTPNAAGWFNQNVSIPFTVTDALSGVASASPSKGVLMISQEGTSATGTVTATDNAGNTAVVSSPSIKLDKTPPHLNLPAPITVPGGPSGSGAVPVTYTASATDNLDPSPKVTCDRLSGSRFPIGTTTVTCTAQDQAGNTSPPGTFTVIVQPVLTLTISTSPGVSGSIVSNPAGINCPAAGGHNCSAAFAPGQVVTLTPQSTPGGWTWTGCDTPTGSVCTVTMSTSKEVEWGLD